MIRVLKLSIGCVWGWVLLIFGLWVWQQRAALASVVGPDQADLLDQAIKSLSIFTVAWGYFVFMFFVADRFCPRTPLAMRRFLQVFVAVTAVGGLVSMGWHVGMIVARS